MLRKALYSCIALGALCAAPPLATALCALQFQSIRTVITVPLTAVLLAFLISALTRTWRRFFLACFPLFLVSAAFAAYTVSVGVPPGNTIAIVLVTASWEEIIGFLSLSGDKGPLLLFLCASAGYLLLAMRLPHLPIFSGNPLVRGITLSRILLLASLPVVVYAASDSSDLIDGIANNPVIGSAMFLAGDLPRAHSDMKGALVHKVPYRAKRAGGEEVHVLVVGESARRDSWSAYGYRRPSTPYIEKIKSEAILLEDAVADANLTSWSVPIILTGQTPEQLTVVPIRGNILDLAKEAGYSTTWLVNQDIEMSTFVGIHADHLYYPAEVTRSFFGRTTLDQALLPAYRAQISRAGNARFIGIHIMGSHWIYSRRYPAGFQPFGSAAGLNEVTIFNSDERDSETVLNAYDNSVRYTDWFLQQLIEQVRTLKVPATLTFFPDHGEDLRLLDGRMGHGAPIYTRHAFEIPAFVWVNDAFRKAYPEKVSAMQANAGKEIRSHDVFSTVADLMGITWPEFSPSRSFASSNFVPDTQMKHAAGGVLVSRRR